MKALPKILLALTAFAALSLAYPAKANLITNGDFETGDFTGWTVTHAASGSFIGVGQGEGPDTTFGAGFAAVGHQFDTISQTFATTPGTRYDLSFFYQVADTEFPSDNHFVVLFDGVTVFDDLNADSNFGSTFPFNNLLATSASTTLEFRGFNTPRFDFLDNVSVIAAGVPDAGSTVSLLGCALLGLTALRRKLSC